MEESVALTVVVEVVTDLSVEVGFAPDVAECGGGQEPVHGNGFSGNGEDGFGRLVEGAATPVVRVPPLPAGTSGVMLSAALAAPLWYASRVWSFLLRQWSVGILQE